MSISIRNPQVEKLAREMAEKLDLSMTQVIIDALEEKKRQMAAREQPNLFLLKEIKSISDECAALPDLDKRNPDEILGYDKDGGMYWS